MATSVVCRIRPAALIIRRLDDECLGVGTVWVGAISVLLPVAEVGVSRTIAVEIVKKQTIQTSLR